MEETVVNKDKLWRIRIWLQFPKKIVPAEPPKKPGESPASLKMIDIYPQITCLRSDQLLVNLKHTNEGEANYLLECYAKGTNPRSTWQSISGNVELILDTLSFAFQIPIKKIRFEIIDMTPPLTIQTERECMCGNDIPNVHKDSKMKIVEEWGNKISPKLLGSSLDETIEASLRWYSKGLNSNIIVDKFVFFWIALETLSLPAKSEREKVFFECSKCHTKIRECPKCQHSSLHVVGTTKRLRELVITKLGFTSSDFDCLWTERQMFHASNKLLENEIEQLLKATILLKRVVLRALKFRLGLNDEASPVLIQDFGGQIIKGEPTMTINAKITKEHIQSFSESKPMLRATLYKGTHLLD